MSPSYKKIIEYSLFSIIGVICLVYLEKLSLNLIKFFDLKYLLLIIIFLIFIIKYSNIKNIFNKILQFSEKINNLSYKNISLLTILISILFIISAYILNKFNIATNFFREENYFILYAISKFNLFACLILSFISTGFFLCYLFNQELTLSSKDKLNSSSQIVLFLGYGIIILSIISIILGLLGLLYFNIILILISVIILNSKKTFDYFLKTNSKNVNGPNEFLQNFYYITLLVSFFFLFIRILLPFRDDGDVWGHYLNFYDSIVLSNKIFNPDFWVHFAQTKGLGLNFLTIIISDIFSGQIASFIFLTLIFLIIFDIGKNFKKSKILLGLISMVICSFGMTLDNDINNISLNKAHIQFNALYLFCLWIIFKFYNYKPSKKTLFLISIPFVFTGFAHSLFSFIIFLSLSFLFLFYLIFTRKFSFVLFFSIFGVCLGVLTSFIINYIQLGVPEAAFSNIFWEYSDQEKFKNIIGFKAIAWPLIDTDQIKYSLNFEFIKANFNDVLFTYSLSIFRSKISLLMYLGLIFYLLINKNYRYIFILLSLLGCFLTAMMVYYIFYSPSINNVIFFINSILAIIFTISLIIFLKYTNSFVNKSTEYLFILPTLFFLSFFVHKTFIKNQHFYKSLFIEGKSLEYNFLKCDDQHVDCMLFKFINSVNKKYNYKKVYALAQHGGVGSTLPRPGIMVEPYFNSLENFRNLKDLSNDDVAYEFLSNNIEYIIFDLKRSIENPGNFISKDFIQNNLEVVESNNNIYLLKIKKNVEVKNYYFINLVDLKMSYITNYIFSDKFIKMSSNKSKKEVLNNIKKNTECLNDFNKELIYNAFETNIDLATADKDYLKKIRFEILKAISLTYNLDDLKFYNKDHFKWSLTVLGNLTREVSNFQKLNIAKKYKRECIFH